MSTRRDLPPRVYRKHGAFWHVAAQGPKRIWTRLCPIADGIPAMYRALAEVETAEIQADTMPKMIGDWLREFTAAQAAQEDALRHFIGLEVFTAAQAAQETRLW